MPALFVAGYLAAVVAANLSAAFVAARVPLRWFAVFDFLICFIFIAVDLVVRDTLHEHWEGRGLWLRMLGLIGTGSVLSALVNGAASRIALASFCAFLAAGLTDTLVYHLARRFPRFTRVNTSNLASAFADSLVWPLVAFGSLQVGLTAVEFAAKVLGGAAWAALLLRTVWREQAWDAGPVDQ